MKSESCVARIGMTMISAERQHDDEADQDEDRRHDARQAEPLQPVGDRIEEIGEHHAGHEGQQDLAEDVEEHRDHDRGDGPEADLPAKPRRQRRIRSQIIRCGAAPSPLPVMCLSQGTR